MTKRVRRQPEESRRLIMEATERLLSERGPNAMGLKDVAKEAGVSHALVSHYFGTRDNLIEATLKQHLEARRDRQIERIRSSPGAGPATWLRAYIEDVQHPMSARLVAWGLLSGRLDADDFFAVRSKGSRMVADVLENALSARGYAVSRDDIEFALALLAVAPYGWAVGNKAVLGSMGYEASKERDAWFFERFVQLIESMLGDGPAA